MDRERKLEILVVTCMYSIYRLLWGRVLDPLCEVRWIGSINEIVSHCVVMDPGHAHTHTHIHIDTHCAPSPGSYHYPSLHPPFGISRPDRSWPITLSHSRPAYLSLSHPLSYLTFSVSLFFHTISPLPVSSPSHNSLLPTNCISFKIT